MTCTNKRYADEATAKRVLWAMKQNGRGEGLTVKPCKACNGWHLKRS